MLKALNDAMPNPAPTIYPVEAGAKVRLPDPVEELYLARKVRMEAPALDLSRALDRLQHSIDADDIARCRLIRKELAKRALLAEYGDAGAQEQAREIAEKPYRRQVAHGPLKTQAEIDVEAAEAADRVARNRAARAMNRIMCGVALILGLAFVLGQIIRAVTL